MNLILSIVLFVVGLVLVVMGVNQADSAASSISRVFTGEPTDRALWLLIGGGALVLLGAGGLFRRGK